MKKALTIAGSDSGGGAGVQQDLKVFSSLGVHGTSAITAITAQNTIGVQRIEIPSLDIISSQVDSILADISPDAVKTGMLADSEVIRLIHKKVNDYQIKNLVVDPVMISTSGDQLLDDDSIEELKWLVSISSLTTPNIYEAEILSGIKIDTEKDMERSAKKIGNCVVTGGHLNRTDVLHYNGKFYYFKTKEKIEARVHGAGCAFSAAVTAYLAKGMDIPLAVKNAKEFIDGSISRNFSVGHGLTILDTSSLKLGKTFKEKEKSFVIKNIEDAIHEFTSSENSYRLIPQVGVNIAMALADAKEINDVAGITGRLVKDRRHVVPTGIIDFGGSSHVGRIVLTVMQYDPEKRAAMNIRFSDEILDACGKLGLTTSGFNREEQPDNTKTMEWGTSEAIKRIEKVPDIIYDMGSVGKEPIIRIIGKDARAVVGIALRIGNF